MLLTALGGKILQMRKKKIVKKGGSYPPLLLTALGGKILKILQMRKQNCQKGGSYPRVPVV
jgi:hypothetical protein